MGGSCKYHDHDGCACAKWGRWSDKKAQAIAAGVAAVAILGAIVGLIYYGIYSYRTLVYNGSSVHDIRMAGAALAAWGVSLILVGIAGANAFWCRNRCTTSDESMRGWSRVAIATMSFILLFIFFPLLLWSISPLAAALAMGLAAFASIAYVRSAYYKFSCWAASFWFAGTVVAVILLVYSLTFTFRVVA